MSELIQKCNNHIIRLQLLTGVSALVLSAYISPALGRDNDQTTVWIELGGQLNRLNDGVEPFAPPFTVMRPSNFTPSQKFEKQPFYGFDEYGRISVQSENSSWVFSAQVRYGRSSIARHVRQQSPFASPQRYYLYPSYPSIYHATRSPIAARFADTTARDAERHMIADFEVGKDVGLGLFNNRSSSIISMGVRFAQFTDKSNISLKSNPDWRFQIKTLYYGPYKINGLAQPYHSNAAGFAADRSFQGIGPTVSWSESAPLAGNLQDGELDFDWGINAAVLFGRQKARTQHHETVRYNSGGYGTIIDVNFGYTHSLTTVYQHTTPQKTRSRSVTVPNVGGFAGISVKYAAAKLSFGYKADFFFGAMDGGIDTRKTYDRNFYGPFATISIRLGG
jgi:hypothetical protein